MNMNRTRKLNLKSFIRNATASGTVADFAREFDIDPSYISQLLNEHRNIGEKSARNLEKKVGLAALELDKPVDDKVAEEQAIYLANQAGPDVLAMLQHYLKASPELKAGAARLLGVPVDYDSSKTKK